MPEITAGGRVLRLCHSMNVHPGESVDDIERALKDGPAEIRRRLFPGRPTGAGLRLSGPASESLVVDPARLARLKSALEKDHLFAFTANAFPYGDFHGPRVKEQVFRPGWQDRARVAYTVAAAHALASLGGGLQVSISTVAGGYRPEASDARVCEAMARNLAEAAAAMHRIKEETGVSVRICLEPEPLTTVETMTEAVAFFRNFVYTGGEKALTGTAKFTMSRASDILHEHLGLCYDCCHQAVLYEDPAESLDQIERAGIVIGKMQLSCALEGPVRELQKFAEPRYLHQVADPIGRRGADLDGLGSEWLEVAEARTHFHVPIFLKSMGGLKTTRPFLERSVEIAVERGLTSDLEIETYTWDVIPEKERRELCGATLADCLVKEYEWVVGFLKTMA